MSTQTGDRDQDDGVCQCREDFRPVVPVGALRRGWTLRHVDGEQRQSKPCDIGEHVPGIRQECKAAGEPPGDQLGHEVGACKRKGTSEP